MWISERARSMHCTKKRFPCISPTYLTVIFWRICDLVSRFTIFTLLWSAVGGLYLALYGILNCVLYSMLSLYTSLFVHCPHILQWIKCLLGLQSVVGIPLRRQPVLIVIRFVDNLCILSIIAVFSWMDFDCFGCTDQSASTNPFIRYSIYIAIVTSALQSAIHGVLCCTEVVSLKPVYQDVIIANIDQIAKNIDKNMKITTFMKARKMQAMQVHPVYAERVQWVQ